MKTLPNFFIVGAARSGTTSLDHYLSQHPQIYIAPRKETHFFAAHLFPSSFSGPGDDGLSRGVIRDAEQYAELFAGAAEAKAIGEASAFYLGFPQVAERIAREVPEARIIIILREPVARAFSAYMHLIRDGRETLGFAEGLSREEERKQQGFEPMWWYKELSLYSSQVKHYLEVFDPLRVKVLLYDELVSDPRLVLHDIFTFLEVKADVVVNTSVRYNLSGIPKSRKLYSLLDHFIHNPSPLQKRIRSLVPMHLRLAWASKAKGKLLHPISPDPQLSAQLKGYFAADVEKLEGLLQRDLRCWHYREPAMAQRP